MKPIGNTLAALAILILAFGGNIAMGAVTASLDRDRVALGDTLRLTLSTTDNEDINDADLRPLGADFEVVGNTTSSSTNITNGRISHSRKMTIELIPKREGKVEIPSLRVGKSTTASIPVMVGPAADTHTDGQTVMFEAEVDQRDVYVQGQVILTLRLQQAVNLEGRSISELKLDNAFVKPLEQRSFQRTAAGRPWLVDEVRYAIFPEQSGSLEIPGLVFSGRLQRGRRSIFDLGGGGELVRRSTTPITINVLPKPASFTADTWLPASKLTLEETWSTPPDELRVGESATRTIQIVGEGLQGAQLPPILFTPIDGLKYYPDQPQISEIEVSSGLEGIRQDSAAVVATRPGSYLIPEIRVPWWDTATEQMQYAVLPERKITVMEAEAGSSAAAGPVPSPAPGDTAGAVLTTTAPPQVDGLWWKIVAAVSTLGWLLTLFYLWRLLRSGKRGKVRETGSDNNSEKRAFKQLLAACKVGDAALARSAVIDWATALSTGARPVSLEQVGRLLNDEEIIQELEILDGRLYSPDQGNWVGDRLASCVRRLRGSNQNVSNSEAEQLRLYPGTS